MDTIDIYTAAHIMSFLDYKSKINFASTCKFLRKLVEFIEEINVNKFTTEEQLHKYKNLKTLNLNITGVKIDLSKFQQLTTFRCPGYNLSKIINFYNVNSLTTLDVSNCTNLLEIDSFKNLTSLTCCWNYKISGLDSLAKTLTYLDCTGCHNIKNLNKLVNLTELNCSKCDQVKNLDNLINLTSLNCNGCTKISDINKLTNLVTLRMNDTNIMNIDKLVNLEMLERCLVEQEFANMIDLGKLIKLTHLKCSRYYVSNEDNLPNLKSIEYVK